MTRVLSDPDEPRSVAVHRCESTGARSIVQSATYSDSDRTCAAVAASDRGRCSFTSPPTAWSTGERLTRREQARAEDYVAAALARVGEIQFLDFRTSRRPGRRRRVARLMRRLAVAA